MLQIHQTLTQRSGSYLASYVAASLHLIYNTAPIQKSMAPIKVGVIGYGFASKNFHLPFINAIPAYDVIAILQRAEAPAHGASVVKGTHCTIDFPKVKHHRTAEEFFANSEIDFVVVASHADTHVSFAEQALKAGKHGV
jgi:predicted dehydrogenase